jgi:tetratricopeptide (TPR) repeat protein
MGLSLADVLAGYIKRARYTPGLLSRLTGLPKATVVNWLEGRVRRPRDWRAVVRVADALRLSEQDADTLLSAAGHPSLRDLRARVSDVRDRAAFELWHLVSTHPAVIDPLSITQAEQLLATMPLEGLPDAAALPAASDVPVGRNALFVGRTAELRALAAAFRPRTGAASSATVAVTGLGGVGKTQLAIEFAHRYGQFFAGGVYWIRCEEPEAIAGQVAWCGGPGCMDLHPSFVGLPLERQVQLVRAAWQSPMPRLLIFDNCEAPEVLVRWRPPTGGTRVLVTARRQHWPAALGVEVHPLEVLGEVESVALLRSHRPDRDISDAQLAAVAAELGFLPLALHLSGSYMARYRVSMDVQHYLGQLRVSHAVLHPSLINREVSPTGHVQHVARTFAVSVDQLEPSDATDSKALRALFLAASLAPGVPIARDLLLELLRRDAGGRESATSAEDGIARLLALGLVEETDAGDLKIHRLVASFARSREHGAQSETAVGQALFHVACDIGEAGIIPPLRRLEPHLRHVTQTAVSQNSHDALSLCYVLGYHLWLCGSYDESRQYLEMALSLAERRSHSARERAEIVNQLALAYQLQCSFAQAQSLFEQALRLWAESDGPYHENTARGHYCLGYILLLQGDYPSAERSLRAALSIRRQRCDLAHPETARTIHSLGYLALLQGRYRRARHYLSLALRIRRRVLPPGHNAVAMSLNMLGEVYYAEGALEQAWNTHQAALEIRRAQFGEIHHHTAESLYNLGRVLHRRGDYEGAHALLTKAYHICETVLGPGHRETLFALTALGVLARDQGRLDDAARTLEEALTGWKQQLGDHHPHTLSTAAQLRLVSTAQQRSADQAPEVNASLPGGAAGPLRRRRRARS